jgi:3-hydroxyisobutyrate dehydrogenase-like beta-hydroxyacid dehydrogenase
MGEEVVSNSGEEVKAVIIGFIGAGLMGRGMVLNLLMAGHEVRVIAHRSRAVIEELVERGAREVPTLAALAADADAIILCVSDSRAVEDVLEKIGPHLAAGQTVIDCGTSEPASTERIAKDLSARGIPFADAPLAGGTRQAEDGTLGVLLGCDDHVRPKAEPVLEAFASTIRHFGPPGSGHRAKLFNNYLVMGMIALVAETYTGAREAGIAWDDLYAVMLNGSANSGVLRKMVEPALAGDFEGYQFSLANVLKDVQYFRALGNSSELSGAIENFFVQHGHGDLNASRLLDPDVT